MTGPDKKSQAECGKCAFCVASCPVMAATGRQAWGPRARLYALKELARENNPDSSDGSLARAVFQCTLCGRCQSICPSGLDIGNRFAAGRESLAGQGQAPPLLTGAARAVTASGNPLGQERQSRAEWLPRDFTAPAQAPLVWWVGCLGAWQDAKIAPALLKILQASGREFTLLGAAEDCCGYLTHLAGEKEAFETLARTNAAKLAASGCREIISGCAGCALTLNQLYPEAGLEVPPTRHFVLWLDELLQKNGLAFNPEAEPLKVAWHDPCDLGRGQGIYEPPRRILATLPGVELLEFPNNRASADCCGGGGGLKAVDPDLSLAIAKARVDQAAQMDAQAIASACPSCKRNLSQAARQLKKEGGPKIKVLDIAELVAARLE